MIKISIVDDHPIVLNGLKNLLDAQDHFQVGVCFADGKSALEGMASSQLDVLLLDINLPDISGLDLCRQIKNDYSEVSIIALSIHDERAVIKSMLENGASGYVLKNAAGNEIVDAIENVWKGEKYLCKASKLAIAKDLENDPDQVPLITRREKEVLQLISKGHTTHEIAQTLFISVHTVESHRKKLIQKFEANNITSVVRLAMKYNLL